MLGRPWGRGILLGKQHNSEILQSRDESSLKAGMSKLCRLVARSHSSVESKASIVLEPVLHSGHQRTVLRASTRWRCRAKGQSQVFAS